MPYSVSFTRRAARDLDHLYGYIHAEDSAAAERWFRRLEELILSLTSAPRMGSVTPENSSHRQLIYGNKPHLYRIIYILNDASKLIVILQIRHGRRTRLPQS
jgi:plasmid stabilization system protein ParE